MKVTASRIAITSGVINTVFSILMQAYGNPIENLEYLLVNSAIIGVTTIVSVIAATYILSDNQPAIEG